MDADWLPFDPKPSKPEFVPPAGSVDAHCHVFGPGSRFPYAPERKYTPCDAPKEELFKLRRLLGFDKNVIVQATCHGTDNSALLDALDASEGTARGVAVVDTGVSDRELVRLHEAGVRGVRFNFLKRLADPPSRPDLLKLASRLKDHGWHVVIYFEGQDLPDLMGFFERIPTTVVVDHMGRPDVRKSAEGPEFELFMKMMNRNPNIYTKVTCPERLTHQKPPYYEDVIPFARRLTNEFPERVLWRTDWPHPNMKSHMPDDGKLVDFIPRIADTDEARLKILVENPTKLYWTD